MYLARAAAPSLPDLIVQGYDFPAKRWESLKPGVARQAAIEAALWDDDSQTFAFGDRLFIGDVCGERVIVEVA